MSIDLDHPFKPGTRVAYCQYRDGDYVEKFVDKVHKNGRFTLRGSPQQWRPSRWGAQWSASETGDNWSRAYVKLWDESTDKEISECIALQQKRDRILKARRKLENLRPGDITDEALEAVERALFPKEEASP